jgi:aryl-alcohol dehydrogenase-like predicted oxidoreductase
MKLMLGGAQFGMAYGATNETGRLSNDKIAAILQAAKASGIGLIDTAPAYGNSEATIGVIPAAADFAIVTKTLAGDELLHEPAALSDQLARSLDLLRRPHVEGLLFHNADMLTGPEGDRLWAEAQALKDEGKVAKIGVSVYDSAQIEQILARIAPDIVQLPINALDKRLENSGTLQDLARRGIEVHARSVLLQGLLVADPDRIAPRFATLAGHLRTWQAAVANSGLTPLAAALGYLRDNAAVSRIIVGVLSTVQLAEIVEAYDSAAVFVDHGDHCVSDPALVDPRYWS